MGSRKNVVATFINMSGKKQGYYESSNKQSVALFKNCFTQRSKGVSSSVKQLSRGVRKKGMVNEAKHSNIT